MGNCACSITHTHRTLSGAKSTSAPSKLYSPAWDAEANRPQAINEPKHHETQYQSKQPVLFDPRWLRNPVEGDPPQPQPLKRAVAGGRQLRLYLGPELVK